MRGGGLISLRCSSAPERVVTEQGLRLIIETYQGYLA